MDPAFTTVIAMCAFLLGFVYGNTRKAQLRIIVPPHGIVTLTPSEDTRVGVVFEKAPPLGAGGTKEEAK